MSGKRPAGRSKRPHHDQQGNFRLPGLKEIVEVGNLLRVFHELKSSAGQSPGADGIAYRDIGRGEAVDVMRDLSKSVLDGSYRPQPVRRVNIPKVGGGTRQLSLPTVCDRVLASALYEAIAPAFEVVFLEFSHGFRPDRSAWTLLADIERQMVISGKWTLVNDDVRRAFDCVTISTVMNSIRQVVDHPDLLRLAETILRGHDSKDVGIGQGNALSPLALNVLLHFANDLVLRDHNPFPWRYADNLGGITGSVPEGHLFRAHASEALARVGLHLKGDTDPDSCIVDLTAGKSQLMGFNLSYSEGRLIYEIGNDASEQVRALLLSAHDQTNSQMAAQSAIRGWLSWCGPTFETQAVNLPRMILSVAAEMEFRETFSLSSLWQQWERSFKRWQVCRSAACLRHSISA